MDTKNIVAAISLSAAVIILYSLFFAPTTEQIKKNQQQINKTQNSDTPIIEEEEKINENKNPKKYSLINKISFESNSCVI